MTTHLLRETCGDRKSEKCFVDFCAHQYRDAHVRISTLAAMNPLQEEQVKKAVRALLKHDANKKGGDKTQLFDETDGTVISLIVGMKAFPKKTRNKPYQITLPNPLHEESEICLIVKDPQKAVKQRLEKDPVPGVVKVIGLSKLRANYKTFEAKRNLCDGYDLFIVDRGIVPMLPRLLGKTFFTKKKCGCSSYFCSGGIVVLANVSCWSL